MWRSFSRRALYNKLHGVVKILRFLIPTRRFLLERLEALAWTLFFIGLILIHEALGVDGKTVILSAAGFFAGRIFSHPLAFTLGAVAYVLGKLLS